MLGAEEAQDIIERASALLKPHVQPGPYAQAVYTPGEGQTGLGVDPMEFFPFSPLIGRSNPIAPPAAPAAAPAAAVSGGTEEVDGLSIVGTNGWLLLRLSGLAVVCSVLFEAGPELF